MTDPNGQGVKDPGTPGAGSPAGEGSATKVVDQEIELTTATGEKVKLKASDIIDDKGVPYKNRFSEAARLTQEKEEELERLKAPPATVIDPEAGKKKEPEYTQEDLNRMFMTGEGAKAMAHIINQHNVKKVVSDVIQEREVKGVTAARYPDLMNPKTVFFQRVANLMASQGLYNNANGLALAAAKVAEDLSAEGVQFTKGTVTRSNFPTSGGSAVPGDGGGKGGITTPELDDAGKALAAKLGVDPAKMAQRLANKLAKSNVNKGGE